MLKEVASVKPSKKEAENAVRTLLAFAGEDPDRQGLKETPSRVTRAFQEYFSGYNQNPEQILKTTFDEICGYNDIILLRDIDFYSHCEHHMAPIIGVAHIAYVPSNCVIGISKLARVVEIFARRLQIQEKMTAQIAEAIHTHLKPEGVAVILEATHHCLLGRGINKSSAKLITSHFTGVFKNDHKKQDEIRNLIKN